MTTTTTTAQQQLDHILGLDRTDEERRADYHATGDRAYDSAGRLIEEARALMADDPWKAEELLNLAESRLSQARNYWSR
ncbi:hypothetical protein SEA_CRACKLEWINK_121 [Mycobacterium phage Cracklewink]|uniref:Uncharacterized protein n=1 Tax=Mycobacterium phage Bipper TaxID=1805457 RepID=A0A142F2P9_9CAUD|nr:hypothetical protein KCH39_gp056 [Mycobacterium phage Bipper]AMQ67056.1 hypothetical protein SEA_BIPPER_121 [Mycobacterium phage Bipper]QDF19407.1 hypothetical protein SEA_CRACKLEWINK_121 [Mycobacterium phage Cracklewink]